MTITTLASAEYWLSHRIAPIPILPRDKRPLRPWSEYQTTLPAYADLLAWFGDGSLNNVAIVCGWNNTITLDFDARPAWADWRAWIESARPAVAERASQSRQAFTGRGRHLYARLNHPVRSRPLRRLGIDIKAQGGYVVVPPSIHPSGRVYRYQNPDAPILCCNTLSDLLPPDILIEAELQDPDPASSVRIVLPDLAPPSSDPWDVAAHAMEFDRARGLARIKAAFRIEEWFPNRTPSSRDGRWFLATCPWHEDRHPSFWIDTQRQLCGCHAGCTPKPMDVIDLVARVCSVSNEDAIRSLSQVAGGR